jgi:Fe-S-cluster-containing hydrogenase component 2
MAVEPDPAVQQQIPAGRRAFLKQAAAVGASAVFAGIGASALLKGPVAARPADAKGVIMPDPSLCIGCLTCEVICTDVHRAAGLSDVPRIRIYKLDSVAVSPAIVENFGQRGTYFQQVCLQCPDAPCLPVCPANALRVDAKTGARVIDPIACVACGKCDEACLFPSLDEGLAANTLLFEQRSRITYDAKLDVFGKCDLCYFRDEGPACVERCPVNLAILDGRVQSDVPCLALGKAETGDNFEAMRKRQTVAPSRIEIVQ